MSKFFSHARTRVTIVAINALAIASFAFGNVASAASPISAYAMADGYYWLWTSSPSYNDGWENVDTGRCDNNTDYNYVTTGGWKESYAVNISAIPDGSTITRIIVNSCAAKYTSSTYNSLYTTFYRLNGSDSAPGSSINVTSTTYYTWNANDYQNLSITKTSSTTLEVAANYVSTHNYGVKLSAIHATIHYTEP